MLLPTMGHGLLFPILPLFSAADLENYFTALSPFCFPHLAFRCNPENLVLLGVLCLLHSPLEPLAAALPCPPLVCCVHITAEIRYQPAGDVSDV